MTIRTAVLAGVVLLAALARLVPHPPNFTPIGALALFAACHFRSRWAAFLVPLAAMAVSDVALEVGTRLGWFSGWLAQGHGFHRGMGAVYGAVVLISGVGLLLQRKKTALTISAAVLSASVLFFLDTNFAVWAGESLYPPTLEGLLLCYTMAIPFFHWTVLGDVFYATVLFGGLALVEKWTADFRTTAAVEST